MTGEIVILSNSKEIKMKKLLIPIILLSLPIFLQAQSCSMRSMFRSYDPGTEVTRIHIPSCLTSIACWFVDDDETRHLLRKIKSVYVMSSEDKSFSKESNFPSEIAKKLKKRNFEEMMVVKSEGDNVNILYRELKRDRKEFVITVDGDEDAMVYIKSKIDLAELSKLGDFGVKGVKLDEVLKGI